MTDQYFDIGHGLVASNLPIHQHLFSYEGRTFVRFLDHIGVPEPLDRLSVDQLVAINRAREELLNSGVLQPSAARAVFAKLILNLRPASTMEIGPGRFPLSTVPSSSQKWYFEIDAEAAADLEKRGLWVVSGPENTSQTGQPRLRTIDLVFGVHFAHFFIEQSALAWAFSLLSRNGVFIANFIAGNTTMPFRILDAASRLKLRTGIAKPAGSAENEWYLVCARSQRQLEAATEALIEA